MLLRLKCGGRRLGTTGSVGIVEDVDIYVVGKEIGRKEKSLVCIRKNMKIQDMYTSKFLNVYDQDSRHVYVKT